MRENIYILMVDDDEDDRIIFSAVAKEANPEIKTRIETLSDGAECIDYFKNEPKEKPDLVFLDINMPRKNGFECLKELRELDGCKLLPIVILSTSGEQSDIESAIKLGADAFIRKPDSIQKLRQLILTIISINWEEKLRNERDFKILNVR